MGQERDSHTNMSGMTDRVGTLLEANATLTSFISGYCLWDAAFLVRVFIVVIKTMTINGLVRKELFQLTPHH